MRLADICLAIVDCEHKTAPVGDGFAYAVGTKAMQDGRLILDHARPVNAATYAAWTRRMRPAAGDLILAREAPVGDVVRVPPYPLICLGQRTVLIRSDESKVHPRFLHYWLLGPDAQGVMRSQTGGATVGHLNVEDIRKLDTSLMPKCRAQQAHAADVLGALDDLIENNRRRVVLLAEMTRAIYREWFVRFHYPGHGAVPVMQSEGGSIPADWAAVTIGDVLTLRYGKALKAESRSRGHVPVVGSSGLVGWHNTSIVEGPAVVLGRKGNVGAVSWLDEPCWPIDTTYYVESSLPLRFVAEMLREVEFVNSHAAVPGLSRESAYGKRVLIPPMNLLDQFQEHADALGREATTLLAAGEKLAALRDLLLPKLVSGQIDVSTLDLDALIEEQVG